MPQKQSTSVTRLPREEWRPTLADAGREHNIDKAHERALVMKDDMDRAKAMGRLANDLDHKDIKTAVMERAGASHDSSTGLDDMLAASRLVPELEFGASELGITQHDFVPVDRRVIGMGKEFTQADSEALTPVARELANKLATEYEESASSKDEFFVKYGVDPVKTEAGRGIRDQLASEPKDTPENS